MLEATTALPPDCDLWGAKRSGSPDGLHHLRRRRHDAASTAHGLAPSSSSSAEKPSSVPPESTKSSGPCWKKNITVHITSDLGPWDDCWPREASVIYCPRQQLLLAKLFCDFTQQTMYWDDIKDMAWHYDAPEDHPWSCRRPLCTVAHRVQLLSKAFSPTDPSVSLYIPTAETLGHHEDLEAALADLARNHNLHLADCDTPGVSTGATDTFRLVVDDLCIFDCNPCGGGVARSNMGAGELQQSMWNRGTESEDNACRGDAMQNEGRRTSG